MARKASRFQTGLTHIFYKKKTDDKKRFQVCLSHGFSTASRAAHYVTAVLRGNKDSVMAMLEAFVHDPLINWRLLNTTGPGENGGGTVWCLYAPRRHSAPVHKHPEGPIVYLVTRHAYVLDSMPLSRFTRACFSSVCTGGVKQTKNVEKRTN